MFRLRLILASLENYQLYTIILYIIMRYCFILYSDQDKQHTT